MASRSSASELDCYPEHLWLKAAGLKVWGLKGL